MTDRTPHTAARVYHAADHARMPWKNGAGTTVEIARAENPETAGMLWRVSIADVANAGEFSAFDGYRRIISVLEGDGMVLTVDGQRSRELLPYHAFAFDGGARTSCELLGGAIRDVNVIYSAERVDARMRWLTLSATERIVSSAETVLVFNAGSDASVRVNGARPHALGHHDCLRVDAAGPTEHEGPTALEGPTELAGPTELEGTSRTSAVCAIVELTVVRR